MSPNTASALGFLVGGVYFVYEEMNQEKESNCSYLSPPTTDVLAFIGAGLLMWKGKELGDPLVSALGGAVAGIHTGQVMHFKLGMSE
jgi:hypothetical protein